MKANLQQAIPGTIVLAGSQVSPGGEQGPAGTGGGGDGFEDAPIDGKPYNRKDVSWEEAVQVKTFYNLGYTKAVGASGIKAEGICFTISKDAYVSRFAAHNSYDFAYTHAFKLWDAVGVLLYTAPVDAEVASQGWMYHVLPEPMLLLAGTYTLSVYFSQYASYFNTSTGAYKPNELITAVVPKMAADDSFPNLDEAGYFYPIDLDVYTIATDTYAIGEAPIDGQSYVRRDASWSGMPMGFGKVYYAKDYALGGMGGFTVIVDPSFELIPGVIIHFASDLRYSSYMYGSIDLKVNNISKWCPVVNHAGYIVKPRDWHARRFYTLTLIESSVSGGMGATGYAWQLISPIGLFHSGGQLKQPPGGPLDITAEVEPRAVSETIICRGYDYISAEIQCLYTQTVPEGQSPPPWVIQLKQLDYGVPVSITLNGISLTTAFGAFPFLIDATLYDDTAVDVYGMFGQTAAGIVPQLLNNAAAPPSLPIGNVLTLNGILSRNWYYNDNPSDRPRLWLS